MLSWKTVSLSLDDLVFRTFSCMVHRSKLLSLLFNKSQLPKGEQLEEESLFRNNSYFIDGMCHEKYATGSKSKRTMIKVTTWNVRGLNEIVKLCIL